MTQESILYKRSNIAGLFTAQARLTPHATAVVDRGRRITYAELDRRANQFARFLLLRKLEGTRIGICLSRNTGLIVAMMGILKAGAAYVPLDAEYPRERLSFMLENVRASALVTSASLRGEFESIDVPLIDIDEQRAAIAAQNTEDPSTPIEPASLAYVIYTSGSTGRPKGVMIQHSSAVAFLDWARQSFAPDEWAGVLASTSICFDLSIFEIFGTLCAGGKVILAASPLELPLLPERDETALINTVPSAMTELLRMGPLPSSVKTVNLAGEALRRNLVQMAYAAGVKRVCNLYGPSEDTTYSTCGTMHPDPAEPITIGRQVEGTGIHILDKDLNPVLRGESGEIWISGSGLARGYFDQPRLTAERFLPNPFGREAGARMYRTGDLGRRLDDGQVEFLGREDHQVKIRGVRIEPGEIETLLEMQPGVRDAVVGITANEDGENRLCAWVVLDHSADSRMQGGF